MRFVVRFACDVNWFEPVMEVTDGQTDRLAEREGEREGKRLAGSKTDVEIARHSDSRNRHLTMKMLHLLSYVLHKAQAGMSVCVENYV